MAKKMVHKKTWDEFRKTGLLWWINRTLHMFGWAICVELDDKTKKAKGSYPARCKFRGFVGASEKKGFIKVSKYLKKNIDKLYNESLE